MLKFCLGLDHGDWVRATEPGQQHTVLDLARLADRIGLDSLWVTEDPDGWDAFALLGAISQQTSDIRLGSGVTNPYLRHPNLIAASVATVDRLSQGRAFVTLGRGQPEVFERKFGLDASRPLARLEATISLLRQWFSQPPTASSSDPVPVVEWTRSISPLAAPPIYLAATGPKALGLAGRMADGVLFNSLATNEFLAWAIDLVRRSALEAGRDPANLAFFANPELTLTDNPEEVLERRKAIVTLIHALPGMDRQLMSSRWNTETIIECVRMAMRTREILDEGGHFPEMRTSGDGAAARACIPAGLVADASITGDEAYALERMDQYEKLGVTHVFLNRHFVGGNEERVACFLGTYQNPEPFRP